MERERLPHHSRQLQKSRWAKQAKPEHTCGEQNADRSPRSLTRLSLDVNRGALPPVAEMPLPRVLCRGGSHTAVWLFALSGRGGVFEAAGFTDMIYRT